VILFLVGQGLCGFHVKQRLDEELVKVGFVELMGGFNEFFEAHYYEE
jgi:hypothetical protein